MERADSSVEPWMIPAEEMASQNQQYADSFCDIKRGISLVMEQIDNQFLQYTFQSHFPSA